MNLYLRLLIELLRGHFSQRTSVAHIGEARFRVMPHDIDIFGHMNNGRYLQIMDVARARWMAQSGVLSLMWKQRWTATLGGTSIRFRRSLRPFRKYRVTTRLICYDERWFYLEHGFVTTEGVTLAVGLSRAGLRSSSGWEPTRQVMSLLDPEMMSAPVPDYILSIFAADSTMFEAFETSCELLPSPEPNARATTEKSDSRGQVSRRTS